MSVRTHIAGPVRRGSRQVTQRCLRCGYPLLLESSGIDDMASGYALGAAVMTDDDGKQTALDEHRLPTLQLCELKNKGKRRIRVK